MLHTPIFVTSVAATVIGVLPLLLLYRMKKNEEANISNPLDSRISAIIMTAITFFHFSEAFKSVCLGLTAFNYDSFFGIFPIRFVYSAAIAATETARIGAMTAVVIRTADFYTQKTSYTGVDVKNKGSLALYFLNILHLIWPFAATLFVSASLFGQYAGFMMLGDSLITGVATIMVLIRTKELKKHELLPAISKAVIYTNATVTGLISALGFLIGTLIIAFSNELMGNSDFMNDFVMCLPSVYALAVSVLLCNAYADLKQLLASMSSPTAGFPEEPKMKLFF